MNRVFFVFIVLFPCLGYAQLRIGPEFFIKKDLRQFEDPGGYLIEKDYTKLSYGLNLIYEPEKSDFIFQTGFYSNVFVERAELGFGENIIRSGRPLIQSTSALSIPLRLYYKLYWGQGVLYKNIGLNAFGGLNFTFANPGGGGGGPSTIIKRTGTPDTIRSIQNSRTVNNGFHTGLDAGLEFTFQAGKRIQLNYRYMFTLGLNRIIVTDVDYEVASTGERHLARITSYGSGHHHFIGISYLINFKKEKEIPEKERDPYRDVKKRMENR